MAYSIRSPRSWTRSPLLLKLFVGQHIVNGLSVAAGVLAVGVVAAARFGFIGAQPAVLGAIGASIGDFPAPLRDKARTITAGFVLAIFSTSLVLVAQRSVIGEILAIGAISFIAGMVTGLGRWALALSMQLLIPMVLILGVPPTTLRAALAIEALFVLGGIGYLAVAVVVTRLVSTSDRRLMASESFRELAAYLRAYARFTDPHLDLADIYGRVIRQHAALSEQLQGARAILLENPHATPERARLAATIGILLDTLDTLVAAQCDLPHLRDALVTRTLIERIGVLLRAAALDLQHLSLDLLANRSPSLPADHSLARDATHREAMRVVALQETSPATRAAIERTMARLDATRVHIARLEKTLSDDDEAQAAIGSITLSAFRPQRSFDPRPLLAHLTPDSPVFRYATRLALAMMAGGMIAVELGDERHGNWVLLTISVILRANYGLTRQRRNDRLIGTLIGCVAASAAVAYLSVGALVALQIISLAAAHGFARQNYRVTSISASMMALISLHLAEPNLASPIVARLTDTLIGAAIAHLFSYFMPTWETIEAPRVARRLLQRAAGYADIALRRNAVEQDYRLARKDFMEALAAMSDSAVRMGGEPQGARRALDEMTAMLIAAGVLSAHVAAARLDILAAEAALSPTVHERTELTRRWLVARLSDGASVSRRAQPDDAPLGRLRESAIGLVEAAGTYERAAKVPEAAD